MPRNYYTGRGLEIHPNLYHTNKRSLFGKYELHPPGPNDLTEQKILERMNHIFVGDKVKFYSMKECFVAAQVGRHSATIPAIGTVVEHCGGYLMLKLRNGLLESCNYYDILAINGKGWQYTMKRTDVINGEEKYDT